MNKWLAFGLALMGSVVLTAQAQALGHGRGCRTSYCAPAVSCCYTPVTTCVTYVDKQVTCYRNEMRVREVPCTVNCPVMKTVMVERQCTVMVPEWVEQKRVITVMTYVPRQVVRDVTCCRMVPVCVTDPCTGCTYTCCKPETYVQQVTCTVVDCVPVQKEIVCRVCCPKPVLKTYQVCQPVCEWVQKTVVRQECYCVTVPYVVTVKVPVCVPVNPCQPCCQ